MEANAKSPTHEDPRWPAIVCRDASADGRFWYSVITTGVYCRPSCPSRIALAANVAIHDTLADAQATGFRPCRRCRPDDPEATSSATAAIVRACRWIEEAGEAVPLASLATVTPWSPHHFHRRFRAAIGLTPAAYGRAVRDARLRTTLGAGSPATAAIHAAGYGSSGRFYATGEAVLGMKPARYRRGGEGEVVRVAFASSTLGTVLVALTDVGVAAILPGDDPAALRDALARRLPGATLVDAGLEDAALVERVVAVVDARMPVPDLPLDIRGTAFQQRVWDALRAIPSGTTESYAELALRIGAPGAARAVAGACAANAHAVAIPCHRVVRGDGDLAGYRWGRERKRALLERERGD